MGFQEFNHEVSKDAYERNGIMVRQTVENGFTTANTPVTDCNVYDHSAYDPYAYNEFCSKNYWCLKTYNTDCSPSNAYGLTSFQARFVVTLISFVPYYIMMGLLNFLVIPFTMCLFMADEYIENSLATCSLGISGAGSQFSAN